MKTNSIVGMLVNLVIAIVIVAICYKVHVPEYVLMVHENYALFVAKFGFLLACLAFLELPFGYFSIHDSIMTFWLAAVLIIGGLIASQFGVIAVLVPIGFVTIVTTSWACSYQNKLLGLLIGLVLLVSGMAWRDLTPPPKELCDQTSSEELYKNDSDITWVLTCERELHGTKLSTKITTFVGTKAQAIAYGKTWRKELILNCNDFTGVIYDSVKVSVGDVPDIKSAKRGDKTWVGM